MDNHHHSITKRTLTSLTIKSEYKCLTIAEKPLWEDTKRLMNTLSSVTSVFAAADVVFIKTAATSQQIF